MTDLTICCPNCDHAIPLTESLAAPLIAETKRRFETASAQKDREIAVREAGLREQAVALEADRASLAETVAKKLDAERQRIAGEEAVKARQLLAGDLEAKSRALSDLQDVLKSRDEKLAQAQKAQAELIRKERELDDAKREMDLNIEKQVQAALGGVRDKAKLEAEEALGLRVKEKEEQIAGMQRQIEDLKRRAEQGSQQLQGEVFETEFEDLLRAKFPRDIIEPVPKGEFGGDLIQRVMSAAGRPCGVILWEMKRTKGWSDPWLPKLREDQRRAGADFAVIVTTALPKGVQTFSQIDGVWVTDFKCALSVALALRQSIAGIAAAKLASEGQQSKADRIYSYMNSPRFRQRLEAVVEKVNEMRADLDRERKSLLKLWAKREVQINGVFESMAGMCGDLQGIVGKAIVDIEGFDLPAIEDNTEDGEIAA